MVSQQNTKRWKKKKDLTENTRRRFTVCVSTEKTLLNLDYHKDMDLYSGLYVDIIDQIVQSHINYY